MTINIEITEKPDTELLASIHATCFKRAWTAAEIQELLRIKGTYAIMTGGAFGLLRIIADEAEILTLAVKPEERNKGKGNALVAAMRNWAQSQGAKAIFLDVRQSNETAQAIYLNAGFSQVAHRKNYYTHSDGTQEGAIIMRLTLR